MISSTKLSPAGTLVALASGFAWISQSVPCVPRVVPFQVLYSMVWFGLPPYTLWSHSMYRFVLSGEITNCGATAELVVVATFCTDQEGEERESPMIRSTSTPKGLIR